MLWNLSMYRKEPKDQSQDELKINIIKNNNSLKIKYKNYFHLTESKIYLSHKNFICTNLIQNNITSYLYISLKDNTSGEGIIFDQDNNIYIKAHSQTISKLIIDYNHNYLISSSYDKYIKIWKISKMSTTNNCICQLKGHKGRIYDMDLIQNKNKLLSCGMDKNILIWDLEKCILIQNITLSFSFHNLIIKYLSLNENKNIENKNELISIYSNNSLIIIIDINENKVIDKINISNKEGPILFINNQECLYQNKKELNIIIYNFINKKIVGELNGCKNCILLLYKIDKINKIISFDNENNIRVWNYIKKFCELTIKIDFVLYCLYVNNEGNLFCGSLNKTLIYK